MKHIGKVATCTIFASLVSGCANGIGTSASDENTTLSNQKVMDLSMQGIEPAVGQHYEGWVIGTNGVFTTGRFNVTADNQVVAVDRDGNALGSLGNTSSSEHAYSDSTGQELSFILTIEPNGDTDPGPSSVHYVGGDFNGNTTNAIVSHSGAIGANFLTSEFSYILATPTNTADTNNQGIWFLDPTAGPGPSLSLPSLNSSWAYEGWIVDH
ncbi:MAG: hypothetical protein HRT45_11075, partial [Bdellovibrionales bacterium]|nr:hypothetical protein [Bdellovibrionales bacterium]